jgi:disulfide bond formation protein DsbB
MRYWENFFLAFGVGCLIGAVIQPTSWMVAPFGGALVLLGWYLHKKGGSK